MKIDEPDTPFARSPMRTDSEDDSKSPKLSFFPDGNTSLASEAANAKDDETDNSRKGFRQQRKEHYNEMKMARALNSRKLSDDAFQEAEKK